MKSRITLLHRWRFLLATVLCIAIPVASYVAQLGIGMARLESEVRAGELVRQGAIDAPMTQRVLSEHGIAFDPNDAKASGLGAYIVQDSSFERIRIWLTVMSMLGWAAAVALAVSCWARVAPAAHDVRA